MASRLPTRIQARNRVSDNDGIRVHEDITNHETQNLLAFAHRRMGGRVAEPYEKALQVLGQFQIDLLMDSTVVERFDLGAGRLLPAAQLGHAVTEFVQRQ